MIAMKFWGLAPLMLMVATAAAEPTRTVSVRFDQYQHLVERRREVEERLGREGARALDLVIAKAHYEVELGAEAAQVTARFQLKTLREDGWKLIPLMGGGVSVTRFTPPKEGALLVVRDMLPSLATTLAPGTHYLLADGNQDGELVLQFLVPLTEGRTQFVPPAVPLSTVEVATAAEGMLAVDPIARLDEQAKQGGKRVWRGAIRGGEPLTIALIKPPAPVASASPGQPPAPATELVVDQLFAQWALSDNRIRLRERLVIDVRGGATSALVLRKPAALANVQVREEVGSTLLEESSIGRALDPEGRQETLEIKLRQPVQGRLVRLALTAELRADADAPQLTLTPITAHAARTLTEGWLAVSSLLPHALALESADGAKQVPADRLPAGFGPTEGPQVLVAALTSAAPVLHVKQVVQGRPRPISGAIQKLDVVTDLSATTVRSRYRAQVTPGPDGTLLVSLPDGAGWALDEVRGTASDPSMVRQGSYLLHVRGESTPLEFEIRHPEDPLRGTGDATLKLARFDVPAKNVSWTVVEPDGVRMWGWRGSFADTHPPADVFLQRFALGLWSGAGQALLGLFEPTSLSLILVVVLGVTLARSAALGRMPLDASLGQFAFIGFVVVLGAVFVHVLTNAANPGPSLADGRTARIERLEDVSRPPAPAPLPNLAPRPDDPRRDEMPAPPRSEPAPAPAPAAPAPPVRATSVEPTGTTLPGPTTDLHMSATQRVDPAPASAPAAPVVEGRETFSRALMLAADQSLTLEASYVERRWESLPTGAAMLIAILLFLALFLSLRHMLDGGTANMIAGLCLLILWILDLKYPFTATYSAAGFGIPVLLLGSVKLIGHALDIWDSWREEGERFSSRGNTDSRTSETRSGNWSASFPRSSDRNEVAIKEIFAETPPGATAAAAAASDDISFVSEDEESEEARGGDGQ